jgi:maltose alpha-D-glucosyltransferase/alpha-amylase
LPYFLTLGPHSFYWFTLESADSEAKRVATAEAAAPEIVVRGPWEKALAHNRGTSQLERTLPGYLGQRRWFGGKARKILSTRITETVPITFDGRTAQLALVAVEYREGDPELYQIPFAFAVGEDADFLSEYRRDAVIARLRAQVDGGELEGVLCDATFDERFCAALLDVIARRRRASGPHGGIRSRRTRAFNRVRGPLEDTLKPSLLGAEQSNSSVVFGDRLILKLFRRLDPGVNPDYEIGRFLTDRASFHHVPPLAGAIEYSRKKGEPLTLAVLQGFIPNEGDAWSFTLDALDGYFERALTRPGEDSGVTLPEEPPIAHLQEEIPEHVEEKIGGFLEFARLLGQRTAELHMALASRPDEPEFASEPITAMYRRSLYQSSRTRVDQVLELLRRRLSDLPKESQEDARTVLELDSEIDRRLRVVVDEKVGGRRIRCHNDYHLGQVLFTGKDFLIMDFEGEPARPISERRLKRSPLRDVAGMVRSFHYAAVSALIGGRVRPEDIPVLKPWAEFWHHWVAVDFLNAYFEIAGEGNFLPTSPSGISALFDLCLIDKAMYEVAYELNNRPDWVGIPLQGILSLFADAAD